MKALATGLAAAAALLLIAGPAAAETSQASQGELRQLIDELTQQLDRAEKERLADPWFIRDLRAIVGKYHNPWQVAILHDDFSTRGPAPAPPWQVTAGDVAIDWKHGLRTVVVPKAPAQQQQTTQGQQQGGDQLAQQLIGTILQQALGNKQQQQQQQQQQAQQAPADPGYAAVIAPVAISNAFAIEMDITSRPVSGNAPTRLEVGPYQGADAAAGYRLAYAPGASPTIELIRLTSRGTSTLEATTQAINLQDGQLHKLRWTRAPGGAMEVALDGQALFNVTDQSFKDPFTGFAIVNAGGDYAFRQIKIDGTP